MPLTAGTRVGPYEVTALIGTGGMGEVYRAHDTKLHRDIALKVLPDLFATDPERLARFQREAEVLASLNHPNIAAIYGLEEGAGVRALVLEFVEGPTLADRIADGPLPIDETLPIARQIAEALEAAHEHHIIHRDLKPANIKLRPDGTVKVLDFGLAKALDHGRAGSELSKSPTLSVAATRAGVILGTAAYMSPEQARGRPVGELADIWAFGCVLYEMLAGRRAFDGDDVTDTLAAVVRGEPDWSALPANTPPAIHRLLHRSLVKDPADRLHHMADARIEIRAAFSEGPAEAVRTERLPARKAALWRRALPWVAVATASAIVASVTIWTLMSPASRAARQPTRFSVTLPPGVSVPAPLQGLALSPDGRLVVFVGSRGGVQQLFRRAVDQLEAVPIPGTEGASVPFFSPDGRWVGFFTNDALKKVSLDGRPPVTLCAIPGQRRGASWARDDTIVFRSGARPELLRVPAAGGDPQVVAAPRSGEANYDWVDVLPDGDAALITLWSGSVETAQIAVLSLDTGEIQTLVGGTFPRYAASGHIVYWRENALWAVPFSPRRRQVTGAPAPIIDGVAANLGGLAHFDVADDGSLVYLAGGEEAGLRSLVWVDRQGREEPVPGVPPDNYQVVRVSPDGAHLAVDRGGGARDVWTYDVARGTLSRLTTDPADDRYPLWTPDGQRIVFSSRRGGQPELFWQRADGSGQAERLLTLDTNRIQAETWSPDGTRLLFTRGGGGDADIGVLSLDGDRQAKMLIQSQFAEAHPAVSPDGGWLAYHSDPDLSGQFEIYVERFPDLGGRQKISASGGRTPLWSPDGRELFHLSLDGRQVISVSIATEPAFRAGTPTVLFEGPYLPSARGIRPYDLTPDGTRFVMMKLEATTTGTVGLSIIVVQHWFEELKRLVPSR